jgi:asparagine synthase (glutamine-hydrolysing)
MCGIAGIVSEPGANLEPRVRLMTEAMRHRGPDDWGVWSDEVCALGHRRLAIIDLSAAGRNPLSNEASNVWITFNGEIYNFQQLKHELEQAGHQFRSRTDTEVIVHAYEQWGADCLSRLRGMFAFAIWDAARRRLFVARDRTGKKPLFYTQAGDSFMFASELQGLLAAPQVPRRVNLAALDAYLSWGYVPAPHTAFKDVFKLPPAHYLMLDLSAGRSVLNVERYWSLDYEPKARLSREDASEALREKLTEAVRLRMISDVPLGAFLSGGIDSSIVVGLMAGLSARPVKTFSIGFEEAVYNELPHAERVAKRWGTDHHEFIVKPDAVAVLPKLVRHFGEPYADASALPTFYLSQVTRSHVTVALNGDGSDESFAGYDRYFANRLAERTQRLPGFAALARAAARMLPDGRDVKNPAQRAKRFLTAATRPMSERYGEWVSSSTGHFNEALKHSLYSGDMRALLGKERPSAWMESLFAEARCRGAVDAAMAVDVAAYLPNDLLVKVDITSMANSLEARSPFLDHEVMEFAARLPEDLKLRGRQSKYILKHAFADLLPPENVNRPKMGFGVPVADWFRGSLREFLEDTLLSRRAADRGYFEPETIRRLIGEHVERRANHGFQLWNLLMLELWHCEMVEGDFSLAGQAAAHRRFE